MATSGMDPAFNDAITKVAAGISGLPDSYAAGQKHLLAQQIAAFNQEDKNRNYNLKKPLTEAQTRYHTAKAVETEQGTLAAELFPELSRRFLKPVRGLNGEPDRIEFNNDPAVMADVVSNLTRRGINPENVINAYRSGLAGQLAAASKPGTSMPSPNAQIAASRIGKDFGATASSIFSVEDRDAVKSAAEKAAMGRVTAQQDAAWKRAELASNTSKENTKTSQQGQDARTAAGIKSRQEIAAARLQAGVGTRKETSISPEVMRLVEGDPLPDGKRVGGLSSAVIQLAPKDAKGKTREGWDPTPARKVYSDAWYAAYRSTNPPNAPAAHEAAIKAAKDFIDGGERPTTAGTPGATTSAPASPAAAITGISPTPPAATAYAAPTFSDPAENIANARLDQIAASLGMSRQDLVELAKQQGMSVEDYVKSVNTPAQEPAAPPEEPANLLNPAAIERSMYPDSIRTPDTVPNLGEGVLPSAGRLVDATTPASAVSGGLDPNRKPVSPLDAIYGTSDAEVPPAPPEEMARLTAFERERSGLTPEQQAIYDRNAQQTSNYLNSPPNIIGLQDDGVAQYDAAVSYNQQDREARRMAPGENPAAAVTAPAAAAITQPAAAVATPAAAVAAPQAASAAEYAAADRAFVAEDNGQPAPFDPWKTAGMLAGTNRGLPHPAHIFNSKTDPMTLTAPGISFGNTFENAMTTTPVDNSDALLLSSVIESQKIPFNNIGLPKEFVKDSRTYKPADYLYKPDAVEQFMQQTGIDRKSHFGRRVEELQREKFSLMNSVASMSRPGSEVSGGMKDITERLTRLNQKIDSIMKNPYAKISPSAALLVEDFVNTPGLVVNSLSQIPNEENRKYVLKQSEVVHLLKTFTNVTPLPNGNFSVLYPMPTKDNQFVSKLIGQTSRYYATETPDNTMASQYVDGEKMFAAFDRAHLDVQKLFIRDGKLGMKPGDSLARTLVNLTIRSNMEIAKAGQAGLLDELATPRNWFQGLIQYPFK